LSFEGTVTDDIGLQSVTLYLAYNSHAVGSSGKTNHLSLYDLSVPVNAGAERVQVNESIQVSQSVVGSVHQMLGLNPAETPADEFTVAIGAVDTEGQQAYVYSEPIRILGLGYAAP
jgi:hypothetical protein